MKTYPSLKEAKEYEKDYDVIPIAAEIFSDITTPIEVLKKIKQLSKKCFLLESVEGGEKWSRYSFLGYEPILSVKVLNGEMTIDSGFCNSFKTSDPNAEIRKILSQYKSPLIDGMPPFTGGLVGYFAYDYIKYYEKIELKNKAKDTSSDMNLMLFDKVIVFDNLKQKILFIANVKTDFLEENYKRALEEIESLIKIVKSAAVVENEHCTVSLFTAEKTKEQYEATVRAVKHYIYEGDIFQAVPSNLNTATLTGSLLQTYRMLRTINPSPYMFYLSGNDIEIAGASPETLIKKQGDTLITFPIAGTAPRGATEKEDLFLENELISNEKEQSEHNMLVDLSRNDLGKVSLAGTVKVEDYMQIRKFSSVMHITSMVSGTIKNGLDALDALAAVLPAGTLSGAPKKRAMEIIEELEDSRRGIYGGAIGYINFTGDMDLCIAIRTAVLCENTVHIRSGGGVVHESNPEKEYNETMFKAKAITRAIQKATEAEN